MSTDVNVPRVLPWDGVLRVGMTRVALGCKIEVCGETYIVGHTVCPTCSGNGTMRLTSARCTDCNHGYRGVTALISTEGETSVIEQVAEENSPAPTKTGDGGKSGS